MASKILVVDDEESVARTVRDIFVAYGYTAECVLSGNEAIAVAKKMCPDLLLSDILMPGLNGFETALLIREVCPGCRLLFFSAYTGAGTLAEAFTQIFAENGYRFKILMKPLSPKSLLQTVAETLQHEG